MVCHKSIVLATHQIWGKLDKRKKQKWLIIASKSRKISIFCHHHVRGQRYAICHQKINNGNDKMVAEHFYRSSVTTLAGGMDGLLIWLAEHHPYFIKHKRLRILDSNLMVTSNGRFWHMHHAMGGFQYLSFVYALFLSSHAFMIIEYGLTFVLHGIYSYSMKRNTSVAWKIAL